MATPEAHEAAYDGLPVTVARIEAEKLADRLTVYRRGVVPIYENELRDGQWLRPPQAVPAIEAERGRPMTAAEAESYRKGYEALAALVRAPGRQETPEEIAKIDQLRAAAVVHGSRCAARHQDQRLLGEAGGQRRNAKSRGRARSEPYASALTE